MTKAIKMSWVILYGQYALMSSRILFTSFVIDRNHNIKIAWKMNTTIFYLFIKLPSLIPDH